MQRLLVTSTLLWLCIAAAGADAEIAQQHLREEQRARDAAAAAATDITPSQDSARENAFFIFNSVHSAMRQWGSSLNHNGLALIPATVPAGNLFFHGTRLDHPPDGPEWLAFEIEHSENFAASWHGRGRAPGPRPPPDKGRSGHGRDGDDAGKDGGGRDADDSLLRRTDAAQAPLERGDEDDDDKGRKKKKKKPPFPGPGLDVSSRGYFHTYRANRDLKLLYLDGMPAAKCNMGTLDTQDLVLRGKAWNESHPFGDWERAQDVCAAVTRWGYDGVIRMEIGFEVIYCDFSTGLDLVSAVRTPFLDETLGRLGIVSVFSWARGVAHRYDGFSLERIRLDFSRMVSGFWYPINVTNPNPQMSDLPRLAGAGAAAHRALRDRTEVVASEVPAARSVNWQEVVDLIVLRYSDRLAWMVSDGISPRTFAEHVFSLANLHFDFPPTDEDGDPDEDENGWVGSVLLDEDRVAEAKALCARYFLLSVSWRRDDFTPEDELLFTAVMTVTQAICDVVFAVRQVLIEALPDQTALRLAIAAGDHDDNHDDHNGGNDVDFRRAFEVGQPMVRNLTNQLRWTTWKKCGACAVDKICFVAMWPFGRVVDHYAPSCQGQGDIQGSGRLNDSYWRMFDLG